MTLNLDSRQRAMLKAMGITVWSPQQPARSDACASAPTPPVAQHAVSTTPVPAQPPRPAPTPAPLRPPAKTAVTTAALTTAPAATSEAAHTNAWTVHAPALIYPEPTPQPPYRPSTPALQAARWLIVASHPTPLEGEWGALLHNMLRAMGLFQHPHTWLLTLQAPTAPKLAPTRAPSAAPAAPPDIRPAITALNPTIVLLLGATAARAALGTTEPLGSLRGQLHHAGPHPAIVTYDPAFLLRSPATKAAAWADVCLALQQVNSPKP